LTALPTQVQPLTQEGTILGTFQYMAPEQLEGLESDARTDIFALGALLYEMATGKRAFEGKSRTSLIAAIVSSQPPPISAIQPMAPAALDHVVRKCLEKNPDDRWQSAHDVAGQLRWIAEGGSQAGLPIAIPRRGPTWRALAWTAAGIVAGALLTAAWFTGFQVRPPIEARVLRSVVLPPQGQSFALSGLNGGALTLSPDGRYLTFKIHGAEGEDRLWLRPLDSLAARPLPGTNHAAWPFWSPDSRFIAFFADGKLKKVDLAGSPAVTVCDAPEGRSGSWSKDGTLIFSAAPNMPISRVSAAGGKPEVITKLDEEHQETTHRWATFLPDGRHFLYLGGTHTAGVRSEANAVYLAELGSMERSLLVQARSNVAYASGHLLYVRDHILLAQPFDPSSLKVVGDPIPLGESVGYDTGFFRSLFAASEKGLLAYTTGDSAGKNRMVWVDRLGKELSEAGPPSDYGSVSLSSDGRRIAYELTDADSGTSDIYVQDLGREGRTRLTFSPANETRPLWSPDGARIVYSVSAKFDDLFVKPAAGGTEEVLLHSDQDKIVDDWSADGKYLIFEATDRKSTTRWDLWILPLMGDRKPFAYVQTPANEHEGHFSPDGRWIAYVSDESGRNEVYVAPFPATGAKWQVSSGGGFVVLWNRDGKEVLYVALDQTLMSVAVEVHGSAIDLTSPPRPLFQAKNAIGGALAPDGKRILSILAPPENLNLPIYLIDNWPSALASK
jgi:Tol biopolymer transport system component